MSDLILGFTGTRKGLTALQRAALTLRLADLLPAEVHHGDCQGADEALHRLAGQMLIPVVVHPPVKPDLRAWCPSPRILPEKDYLERDRDIAEAAGLLIACPDGPERAKSGTWYTVRYARKLGTPVTVLYPDGRVDEGEDRA